VANKLFGKFKATKFLPPTHVVFESIPARAMSGKQEKAHDDNSIQLFFQYLKSLNAALKRFV